MLSFATTIHKVQGLTFPNVACDMEPSIFTGGMAYVALSRVSSLNNHFDYFFIT
jgi:ATP-dependent exoDNAse (exonuclease V) alpha subunit